MSLTSTYTGELVDVTCSHSMVGVRTR